MTASVRRVLCLGLSPGNNHYAPGAAPAAPAEVRILGDGRGLFERQDGSGRLGFRLCRDRAAQVET